MTDDLINRQAVLDKKELVELEDGQSFYCISPEDVETLPSVIPQPKTGRWLAKSFHEVYCDNCGFDFDIMTNNFIDKMKYCPNCGAKMIDPQESEEKE